MNLTAFRVLSERHAANRASLEDVTNRIPTGRINREWDRFRGLARAQAGVPLGTTVDDDPQTGRNFEVNFLTDRVPVDFLFAESREAAKAAFHALCADHGVAENAPAQVAEVVASMEAVDAGRARDEAELVALAEVIGIEVPVFAEAFADLTRAEFDAAAARMVQMRADLNTLQDFANEVEDAQAWVAFAQGIHDDLDSPLDVDWVVIDESYLGEAEMKAVRAGTVVRFPLAFKFPELRTHVGKAYRYACIAAHAKATVEQADHAAHRAKLEHARNLSKYNNLSRFLGYTE